MEPVLTHRKSGYLRLVAFLLFVSSTFGASMAKADEEHVFAALDAYWRAYGISWVEFEEQWLIGATVVSAAPTRVRLSGLQMFAAFCKELVRMKPNGPGKQKQGLEVFRVDLTIIGADSLPIWSAPIPVRVRDNECQVKEGAQNFYMSYPGGLEGWRFHSVTIQKVGEIYRRQYTFEPDEGASVKIREFDFDLGCGAALKDPAILTLQASLVRQYAIKQIAVQPDTVVIAAKQGTKLGMFFGHVYKTVDGRCVRS